MRALCVGSVAFIVCSAWKKHDSNIFTASSNCKHTETHNKEPFDEMYPIMYFYFNYCFLCNQAMKTKQNVDPAFCDQLDGALHDLGHLVSQPATAHHGPRPSNRAQCGKYSTAMKHGVFDRYLHQNTCFGTFWTGGYMECSGFTSLRDVLHSLLIQTATKRFPYNDGFEVGKYILHKAKENPEHPMQ